MDNNRRDFIKKSALSGIGLMGLSLSENSLQAQSEKKEKPNQDKKSGPLRIGFIGVGSRSRTHVRNTMLIEGVEIVAICDIQQASLDATKQSITEKGRKPPVTSGRIYW